MENSILFLMLIVNFALMAMSFIVMDSSYGKIKQQQKKYKEKYNELEELIEEEILAEIKKINSRINAMRCKQIHLINNQK